MQETKKLSLTNARNKKKNIIIIYPKHEQVELEEFPRRYNHSSDFKLQIYIHWSHRKALPNSSPHNFT